MKNYNIIHLKQALWLLHINMVINKKKSTLGLYW